MASSAHRDDDLYRLLKQVLQNHIATHEMALSDALRGCLLVLGAACLGRCRRGADIEPSVRSTMNHLKSHLRARQACPPLAFFVQRPSPPASTPILGERARVLAQALGQLASDALATDATPLGRGWWIALQLTADVLAMHLHQYQNTLTEMDALIDATLLPVLQRHIQRGYRGRGLSPSPPPAREGH
jgi:hypothetical protein